MTEIHTAYDIYVLGDSATAELMEMLSEKAAEHGAVITETFAFPVGMPREHADLTAVEAVVEALGRAIATRTPVWLPFWHRDFCREEHLRRLSLTLQRHGLDLLVGPDLTPCPISGGFNEIDSALRNEVHLVYALDDAVMAASGMHALSVQIEAELAGTGSQPDQGPPIKGPPVEEITPKEHLFRTTDVAALFGRRRGWVSQKLREGYFLDFDGSVVEPLRTGKGGRRRYPRSMLWAMAWSAFRRGDLSSKRMRAVVVELDRTRR